MKQNLIADSLKSDNTLKGLYEEDHDLIKVLKSAVRSIERTLVLGACNHKENITKTNEFAFVAVNRIGTCFQKDGKDWQGPFWVKSSNKA